MLEGGALSDPAFAKLGDECVLFCAIETADRRPGLREEKQLVGLPSVAVLDADGVVLVNVPHDRRSVEGFRAALGRARRYVRLRAAAAGGDADAAARFLLLQLEERQVAHADALRRRAGLATEDAQVLAAIDQHLVDLEIGEQVRAAGQQGRHRLGERFLAMLERGPRPSPRVTRGFYYAILEWAEREADAAAFERGLGAFRAALAASDPGAPWVGPLLARYEAKLLELRRRR